MIREFEESGREVVIFAYDLGPSKDPKPDLGGRRARWFEARGGSGGATLPLVMVQGGLEVTSAGHRDFRAKYAEMIEAAAEEPPAAEVAAEYRREGRGLRVGVEVKNTGRAALDPAGGAAVVLFAYEEATATHVDRAARGVTRIPLPGPLTPGASLKLSGDLSLGETQDPARVRVLAVVEYKNAEGRWNIAEGALATPGADGEGGPLAWAAALSTAFTAPPTLAPLP